MTGTKKKTPNRIDSARALSDQDPGRAVAGIRSVPHIENRLRDDKDADPIAATGEFMNWLLQSFAALIYHPDRDSAVRDFEQLLHSSQAIARLLGKNLEPAILGPLLEGVSRAYLIQARAERAKLAPHKRTPLSSLNDQELKRRIDILQGAAAILEEPSDSGLGAESRRRPDLASQVREIAERYHFLTWYRKAEADQLRRDRHRPTTPVRIIAEAVDRFLPGTLRTKDRLSADLARDLFQADTTQAKVYELLKSHRRLKKSAHRE